MKIADFGLAKVLRPGDLVGLSQSTQVFGTPHDMAPEQWRGSGGVDHRAGAFSLGVVLYEMLTGQLPLGHFDPPSRHAEVPRDLDEVVRRTLAQQPEDRYQNAQEERSDVERQARCTRTTCAISRSAGTLGAAGGSHGTPAAGCR